MDSTTKCIAFMLLSEGAEKLSRAQITEYAQRLETVRGVGYLWSA